MTTKPERRAKGLEIRAASGPWPFVTRRQYVHDGRHHIWRSRDHRKGLRRGPLPVRPDAWKPESLNLWIGGGFSIGSFLFIVGAVLSIWPAVTRALSLSGSDVNAIFFAGSIFFTTAAYLQLFQAANSGALPHETIAPRRFILLGWQPDQIGWLSSFLQFLGTLLFNVSTFMALVSIENWFRQDLAIWAPDVFGSILFLTSGYLAYIETCHHYWSWRPRDISWWSALVNFAGCIAFMISAVYAYVPSGGANVAQVTASVDWTLVGAAGFLLGAVLMLVECRVNASPQTPSLKRTSLPRDG